MKYLYYVKSILFLTNSMMEKYQNPGAIHIIHVGIFTEEINKK
jgi:hypothetical protein